VAFWGAGCAGLSPSRSYKEGCSCVSAALHAAVSYASVPDEHMAAKFHACRGTAEQESTHHSICSYSAYIACLLMHAATLQSCILNAPHHAVAVYCCVKWKALITVHSALECAKTYAGS
jgi:hypothetical protein